jgi:hypothetical protein
MRWPVGATAISDHIQAALQAIGPGGEVGEHLSQPFELLDGHGTHATEPAACIATSQGSLSVLPSVSSGYHVW